MACQALISSYTRGLGAVSVQGTEFTPLFPVDWIMTWKNGCNTQLLHQILSLNLPLGLNHIMYLLRDLE